VLTAWYRSVAAASTASGKLAVAVGESVVALEFIMTSSSWTDSIRAPR
jgi:hypothetical protein